MFVLCGYDFCSDKNALTEPPVQATRYDEVILSNGIFDHWNVREIDSIPSGGAKETWVIKSNASGEFATTQISFTSNGQKFTSIGVVYDGSAFSLVYGNNEIAIDPGVGGGYEFYNEAYRTITFDTPPTGALLTWLQSNAIKQTSGSETWVIKSDASGEFATTQIAFTSNGQNFTSIGAAYNGAVVILYYDNNEIAGYVPGVSGIFEFDGEAYRKLTFDTPPTGDLLTWLQSNATKQTSDVSVWDLPTVWDFLTVMNANFNGNINAGNINYSLSEINGFKIKRRKTTEFDWVTLKYIPIKDLDDLSFVFNDNLAASGYDYEYAFVPVIGDIEGDYISNTIGSKFEGVFICDQDTIYKFFAGVRYGTNQKVQKIGVFEPYGRKYPVIVSNGLVSYETGSLSGTVLPSDYMKTNKMDRLKITEEKKALFEFLTNKKAKILKDLTNMVTYLQVTPMATWTINLY